MTIDGKLGMRLRVLGILVLGLALSFQVNGQDRWQAADAATVRLKPAVFAQLPSHIVSFLQKRQCTVSQSFGNLKPHNVIRGELARAGQFDWAVLCSRNRVSSILIFWNASTKSVGEIARSDDHDFLHVVDGEGKIGFSRAIGIVGKDYILDHFREYGGRKPPPIHHHGINDAFVEKASTVHYFYRKRWLKLQGAD